MTKTGVCSICKEDITDDEIAVVQAGYEHEPVHARCEDGFGETEAEYVEREAEEETADENCIENHDVCPHCSACRDCSGACQCDRDEYDPSR